MEFPFQVFAGTKDANCFIERGTVWHSQWFRLNGIPTPFRQFLSFHKLQIVGIFIRFIRLTYYFQRSTANGILFEFCTKYQK